MVGPTMNLITGAYHSCERREHAFMILREYTIIFRLYYVRPAYAFDLDSWTNGGTMWFKFNIQWGLTLKHQELLCDLQSRDNHWKWAAHVGVNMWILSSRLKLRNWQALIILLNNIESGFMNLSHCKACTVFIACSTCLRIWFRLLNKWRCHVIYVNLKLG